MEQKQDIEDRPPLQHDKKAKLENVLKFLGDLGVLTCYRIHPFLFLLNKESRNFKYRCLNVIAPGQFKSKLGKGAVDLFDIQTDTGLTFTIDEWGKMHHNPLEKEHQQKIAEDLYELSRYLINSIFRAIAYKYTSYKDLGLDVKDFYNGIVTPVFLEAYNFYDLDFRHILEELGKSKLEKKGFFGKKELEIKVNNSNDKITITCADARIVIPKIKLNLTEYAAEYKFRYPPVISGLSKRYSISWKNGPDGKPIMGGLYLVMDPFNLGAPMLFFSEHIIKEAMQYPEFVSDPDAQESLRTSKIFIPETVAEGDEDTLFQIAGRLSAKLFKNFVEVYTEKFLALR